MRQMRRFARLPWKGASRRDPEQNFLPGSARRGLRLPTPSSRRIDGGVVQATVTSLRRWLPRYRWTSTALAPFDSCAVRSRSVRSSPRNPNRLPRSAGPTLVVSNGHRPQHLDSTSARSCSRAAQPPLDELRQRPPPADPTTRPRPRAPRLPTADRIRWAIAEAGASTPGQQAGLRRARHPSGLRAWRRGK